MILYDENISGNINAWEYCECRMDKFESLSIRTNKNFKATYRSFIKFWVSKMAHFPMVDGGEIENENESVLETDVSSQGTVYITQYNVETYFVQVVVPTAKGASSTIRKKLSALNWFLVQIENRASTIQTVYSPHIVHCMCEQQVYAAHHRSTEQAGVNPHRGLKDIFSEQGFDSIVDNMFNLSRDSFHLLFAYNRGKNAGVCGASSRAMCLSDLNLSTGYGPDCTGPNNNTLLLGSIHEDNHKITKQVGAQRHRDYRQRAVFSTGGLLISRLRELEDGINFLRPNGVNEPGQWWLITLNYFESYSEESTAMRQVLTAAGIHVHHGGKLTHHRSQMVQTAVSRGLQLWQVCTTTKHIQDKFHSAYLPEV